MFDPDHDRSNVSIVPAAKSFRVASEESKYLTCLIVQHQPNHKAGRAVFKRIGVTRLSPWADSKVLARRSLRDEFEILRRMHSDVDMPYEKYDDEAGSHMIRLI